MKFAASILILLMVVIPADASLSMNNVLIPEGSMLREAVQEAAKPASSTVYINANGQRIAKIVNNEMFYFHNDHLGSATVITDKDGNVVEEKMYDPFGIELSGNSKIGYNSKELDKDTELNYYGARYYAADFGRFVTPDTVKGKLVNPQSLNLYAYTLNNPMKYVDPSGNQFMPVFTNPQETFSSPLWQTASSIGLDIMPYLGATKMICEVVCGRDIITGDKVSRLWMLGGLAGMKLARVFSKPMEAIQPGITLAEWESKVATKASAGTRGWNELLDAYRELQAEGKISTRFFMSKYLGVYTHSTGRIKLAAIGDEIESPGAISHELFHHLQYKQLYKEVGESDLLPAQFMRIRGEAAGLNERLLLPSNFWLEYQAWRFEARVSRSLGFPLDAGQKAAAKGPSEFELFFDEAYR